MTSANLVRFSNNLIPLNSIFKVAVSTTPFAGSVTGRSKMKDGYNLKGTFVILTFLCFFVWQFSQNAWLFLIIPKKSIMDNGADIPEHQNSG